MRRPMALLRFCYDFVVGDDAVIAVGLMLALTATALLAHYGIAAWWLMPVAVLLGVSLVRAVRQSE